MLPSEYMSIVAHVSQAVQQIHDTVKNVKVYQDQCARLLDQCSVLLGTLRDNGGKLVGTDCMGAIDETECTLEIISRKVLTWSSWNKLKSIRYQSEIKQGIDDMRQKLAHCATRFNMILQMDIMSGQQLALMSSERNHAETQEKLHVLLDSIHNINTILKQPVGKIEAHMLDIQEVIHAGVAEPEQSHRLQRHLLTIHRQKTEVLPPIIDLTGEVRRIQDDPVNTSGGYSDVYLGEWLGDEKVALKLIHGINQTPGAQGRFRKEVGIWRELQHENVARLYGVATLGGSIYIVSPWMEHGDANHYLQNKPSADRLKLLREAATGLEFLHNRQFVHGDLRGANILISEAEVACITDFGLSVFLEEDPQSSTFDNHGNCRWMAPELIKPELVNLHSIKPNKATDVWGFGMLCLEILTGKRPFDNRPRAGAVITDLISSILPARPPAEVTDCGLSDQLWQLLQQCWDRNPEKRPTMNVVAQRMRSLQLKRPSRLCDITTPVNDGFTRGHPFRQQSASISPLGAVSHVFSRGRYEPSSPRSIASSFGPSIATSSHALDNTGTPPSIIVPLPETYLTTISPSLVRIGDAPRLPPITIGEIHTDLDEDNMDIIPTDLTGQKRTHIVDIERSPTSRSSEFDVALPEHSEESPATSKRPSSVSTQEIMGCIKYRKDGVIASATLLALVERLIQTSSDHRKDLEFRETFFVSYRAFANAEEVFNLLIGRFDYASSYHVPEHRAIVRYSVLKVLVSWLECHPLQTKEIPLLERMQAFTEKIQSPSTARTIVDSTINLKKVIESQMSTLSAMSAPLTPISIPPSPFTPTPPLDITPQAIAEALTLLEGGRYSKIMPSDCIGWLIGVQDNNRISSFVAENDRLSYWVRTSILTPNHHSQRSDARTYFLQVAEECRKLRNYSSSSAIFAGLAWPPIMILKRTGRIGKLESIIYDEIKKLLVSQKNYQAYRKALKASHKPCIPMLHVHLGDVKKTHNLEMTIIKKDGHPDMVNFGLYHDLHVQIGQMLAFQQPPLMLLGGKPSQGIQMFIDNKIRSVVVNDALHQRLNQRAINLQREEAADYVSHGDELKAAGFVR